MTDPESRVTTYAYNSDGDRVSLTDNAGDKTTYVFDGVGRMITSVAPLGNVAGGNPSLYTTSYTTNAFGDVLTVTDPLSELTTYGYDANRNRTSVKDANSHTTSYSFDFGNELTLVTRPDNSTKATTYDGDGNVASQTDGLNHSVSYAYDALNRKIAATDPIHRLTSYGYNLAGNLISITDAAGAVTNYSYDAADEVIQIGYQTALPATVGYQYDKDGRRTQMSDGTGTSGYQYDSVGRLISSTDGSGATVGYGYDKSGRITSLAYPSSLGTVSRTYDLAGRLKTVSDWLNHSTTYSYDANGELTGIAYPNTVTANEGYDHAGHLTTISDQQGQGPPFFSETYSRDSAGQLTSDGTNGYGYDSVDRLTGGGTLAYGYDAADRLTSQTVGGGNTSTLVYDNADQLSTDTITNGGTQVQNYTYGYDSKGNRATRTDIASSVVTYGWDQANRMLSYSAGATSATYAYNGDGIRTQKTVNGNLENFTWDTAEGLPLIIRDGSTSYLTGLGGLPLEQVSGSTVLFYHQDQLGSTRALTNSGGATTATTSFDAYGSLVAGSGTSSAFGFAGQYVDSESGLNYMRARYYDPVAAQFASRDLVADTTRHAYVYSSDNPTDATDPSGLWCAAANAGFTFVSGWETGKGPGAAVSASAALGFCSNGDIFLAPSLGAFAYDQYGDKACYPACAGGEFAAGHYVSYGLGVMASPNAANASQLGGPFTTYCGGLGVGPKVLEGSLASGGGVDEFTYSGFPYPGIGVGAGAARLQTNTFGPLSFNAGQLIKFI